MVPAELIFARKICSVFDRLRPTEKKMDERKKNTNGKYYNPDKEIYFKNYKFGKAMWEGTIDKIISKILYLV